MAKIEYTFALKYRDHLAKVYTVSPFCFGGSGFRVSRCGQDGNQNEDESGFRV